MKQVIFLPALVAMLVLLWPDGVAFGQEDSLRPTVRYQAVFEVANPPAQFEMVQFVEEFGSRAWLPRHSHGGQGFATVLEGAVTVRAQAVEKTYEADETFIEPPGVAMESGNLSAERAKLMLTFLLPQGAELTTKQQRGLSERTPVVKYQTGFEAAQIPGQFDLIQMVVDFAPGAWSPLHSHGGQGLATVLEGAVTVQQEGTEKTYQAGETFIETPGVAMVAGNAGAEKASMAVTFLLPKGAPLTTVQAEAPAMLPDTGGDGGYALRAWYLLLIGSGLIAGGWFLWTRSVRRDEV